jgi:hypothetical protein
MLNKILLIKQTDCIQCSVFTHYLEDVIALNASAESARATSSRSVCFHYYDQDMDGRSALNQSPSVDFDLLGPKFM